MTFELEALSDGNDREILPARLALFENFANLGQRHRELRQEYEIGPAGNTGLPRDPAGLAAHQLDQEYATVRLGRRVQAVERFGRNVDGGVEPERLIRSVDVIVNRLRAADHRH